VATCVAAASVVAKVSRDRLMRELHRRYPDYGFARHKGYSTRSHMRALAAHGPCPEHRYSFVNVGGLASGGHEQALGDGHEQALGGGREPPGRGPAGSNGPALES
jgi:ribonuclease HII